MEPESLKRRRNEGGRIEKHREERGRRQVAPAEQKEEHPPKIRTGTTYLEVSLYISPEIL